MRSTPVLMVIGLVLTACLLCPKAQPPKADAAAPPAESPDWSKAEKGVLAEQIQLTFSDKFVKAGESYFSPDDQRVIFQAVETPPEGEAADEFYAMYVADVSREAASGNITGLANIKRISPNGSANTCGWFHPTDPNVVIFASTLTTPTESTPPGYQRASGNRYKWMFPPEMRIVRCELDKADGTASSLHTLAGDGQAYCAEGSLSNDGRHLLYCSLESNEGDLFVLDLQTRKKHRIVQSKGYDGGPFFSPDGKRICYRSDRRGDNLLQLLVADLAFNKQGEIIGIEREYLLTDDPSVNWCPFWTRDGRRLIYGTSALGHTNYEVFMCDADPGNLSGSTGTIRYGTAQRRITNASGADVLPALSSDGKWMIWTSQRHADRSSQLWAAQFVLDPGKPWKSSAEKTDASAAPVKAEKPAKAEKAAKPTKQDASERITVTDPDTGRIFIYDMGTHKLSEYHMDTHTLTDVTDKALIEHIIELYNQQGGSDQPQ